MVTEEGVKYRFICMKCGNLVHEREYVLPTPMFFLECLTCKTSTPAFSGENAKYNALIYYKEHFGLKCVKES